MNVEKCPLCGNQITSEELSKVKQKLNEENERVSKANAIALRKQLMTEHETSLAAQKVKLETEARKDVDAARKQVTELTQQLGRLNLDQVAYKKQLEKAAVDKLQLESEKLAIERKKALDEQRRVLDDASGKKLAELAAEHRRKEDALEKKLSEAQRQLKDQSAGTIGDGAQISLFDELRRAFPADKVDPVEKGKKGADIHHEVLNDGIKCGLIVYDSKNCQQWRDNFVAKLREDQIASDAEHAVLSTTVFPAGQRELFVQDGVIIVHPARAVYIAEVLRRSLIQLARSCASEHERSEKTQRLYDFIRSPQFSNRLSQATKFAEDLLQFEVEDKGHFDRMAKKRGAKITDIKNSLRDLELEIGQIIGGDLVAVLTNGQPTSASASPNFPR